MPRKSAGRRTACKARRRRNGRAAPLLQHDDKLLAPRKKLLGSRRRTRLTEEERFASKQVRRGKDECWGWLGSVFPGNGYAQFYVRRADRPTNELGHRYAWQHEYGPVPAGKAVLHKRQCKSRTCTNPRHLYLGDAKQNAGDWKAVGTSNKPRLTHGQVVEMRRLRRKGATYVSLSERFGLSCNAVTRVCKRTTYKNVTARSVAAAAKRPLPQWSLFGLSKQ